MGKQILKISAAVLCLILILGGGVGWYGYKALRGFISTPLNPAADQQIFTVLPGRTLSRIAADMHQQGLIANAKYFQWYARWQDAGTRLQAGEYLLSASQSPAQILETLLKGRVNLYRLTIPEGWNLKEIAAAVHDFGACTPETFLSDCRDKTWLKNNRIPAISAEGYLFPDTYFFPKGASCGTILQTMLKRFRQRFTPEMENRAQEMGFSVHEIVTLASIIEKETGDASERPVISSVFHNRLKRRMRLESDPTVIYGIKDFDGNIKKIHLQTPTPYNTYQIKGLPMGPIANPGLESLKAALYPADTDYLFFVSKKDSTHYFSKTIQEHNRAVRRYQLNRR